MAEITSYKSRIEPQDVDFTLRASASSIINYMLNVAGTDADSKGFGVASLQDNKYTWVLSRLGVEIYRQAEQYSNIVIDTWVNEFNRLSSTRNFRMRQDDEVLAAGVSQWCVLDMESRQVVDLSIMKERHDEVMVDAPSPISAPARLRPAEYTASSEYTVAYSDIDFNRHMNTLRYVDMIFDAISLDVIENNCGMRIDFNFIAEARYGERLTIAHSHEGNTWLFEISSSEKTLCRAKVEFK